MSLAAEARIAVIDLGTNSVRFDVHEVGPRHAVRLLHREKLMVRLGENLFTGGKLDRNAVRRTLQAFASFRHTADDLKADKIVAFGTSALREASDGETLLAGIRDAVGIDVRVISGREEARLIAAAVLANEKSAKGDVGLVDIGGGSTEISIVRDGKIVFCHSFPLGAARLQQMFLKDGPPPDPEAVRALKRHTRETLLSKLDRIKRPDVPRLIGSSGTIKALVRLCKKSGGKAIEYEKLRKLTKRMAKMTTDELRTLPGMEPKRVDLILAGGLLLEACMDVLSAGRTTFTEFALRDGILQREVQLLELQRRLDTEVDLKPLYAQAARFGETEARLKKVVALSEALFSRLAPLHRMSPRWLTYLKLAALFRNSGRAISPIDHEKHSYYIAKHVELPLYERWEREFVAQLCLHHEGGKIDPTAIQFHGVKPEKQSRLFPKLLALLRLVDALDPAQHRGVRAKRIAIRPDSVRLLISKGERTELALLKLQQKKDLFEKVYGRSLVTAAR